jgi:hypothetical protein
MVAAVRTERSKSRGHGVRTLPSPPGGGNGICVGTKEARGDVLFFLHADSSLLPGALNRINEVLLANPKIVGGNFRLIFDGYALQPLAYGILCLDTVCRALLWRFRDFRSSLSLPSPRGISFDTVDGGSGLRAPARTVRMHVLYQGSALDHLITAFRGASSSGNLAGVGQAACPVLARRISRPVG